MNELIAKEAIEEAVRVAGGPSALAALIKEGQSTVSMWLTRGQVSAAKASLVSLHTGVTVERLRPDIFGIATQKAA